MLGDFFNIQKQDELNARKLNDLIIEARRKKKAEIDAPTEKRLLQKMRSQATQTLSAEERRLDKIETLEERVTRANKEAERAAQDNAFRDRILEKVEGAIRRSHKKTIEKREDLSKASQDKAAMRKENFQETFERGDRLREDKTSNTHEGQARLEERKRLAKNFQSRIHTERKENQDSAAARNTEEKERGQRVFKKHLAAKDFNADHVKSPSEFQDEIRARKAHDVQNARERADVIAHLAGLPEDKREAFQDRKEDVLNDREHRLGPIEEQFQAVYKEVLEALKNRVEEAYAKGDLHREIKSKIVEKARGIATSRIRDILRRRWVNLFPEKKTDERVIKYIAMVLFRELRNVVILENLIKHQNFKAFEAALQERKESRESSLNAYYQSETIRDKNLIHEVPQAHSLFENYLEKLIKGKSVREAPIAPETLLTFIDGQGTSSSKTPSVPQKTHTPGPNLNMPELITYVDMTDQREEEKVIRAEAELMQRLEKEESIRQDQIAEHNQHAEARRWLHREEQERLIRAYCEKLIEEQNKTAHERAVEMGQWINLFF